MWPAWLCVAAGLAVISIQISRLERHIVGAEQDAVNEVVAQLNKAKAEIVEKIADLEAAVAAGEVPDFSELRAAAQGLDDLNADPAPDPEPEV